MGLEKIELIHTWHTGLQQDIINVPAFSSAIDTGTKTEAKFDVFALCECQIHNGFNPLLLNKTPGVSSSQRINDTCLHLAIIRSH